MKKRNSILWQVTALDQGIHYLMGTMHLKSDDAYTYAVLAEKYISDCSIYAAEMDLAEAEQADLHQYFELPHGQTLNDLYTPKQYARMEKFYYGVIGAELDQIKHLNPMAISNMIAESFVAEQYGLSLDHHLWQVAERREMLMRGLETVQDQINILEQITIKSQIRGLKKVFRNITKYRRSIEKLSQLYVEGNVHAIYKKSKKSLGGMKNLMLHDRNYRMVNRFIELADQGNTFAAVGAAHLAGEKGMLHILKQNGYKIKAVSK